MEMMKEVADEDEEETEEEKRGADRELRSKFMTRRGDMTKEKKMKEEIKKRKRMRRGVSR